MIRSLLNKSVTLRRRGESITDRTLSPVAATNYATGVPARIESAGTTPEATVIGMAGNETYRAWLLTTETVKIDDEVVDGTTVYLVKMITSQAGQDMGPASNHVEVMLEVRP